MAERTRRFSRGTIGLGDGPEIPTTWTEITFDTCPVPPDQWPEDTRLRALGVDPDRVIDGELGQSEIES